MIVNRYLIRTIHLGSFVALLALVGLGLFFTLFGELGDLGEGNYGLLEIFKYVALSVPGTIVEFMPLAALLGSIISLGALASNSEIIAMQASGMTHSRLIGSVLQAAAILAIISFLLADWIVPDSETTASRLRNLALEKTSALVVSEGLWVKDESRVLHFGYLLPDGSAREVEIFELDEQGRVRTTVRAEAAIPLDKGWELHGIEKSMIGVDRIDTEVHEKLTYRGSLSHQMLKAISIKPRQMSTADLLDYLDFLDNNKLDSRAARLIFWQKMFAPLTIIIMCLLAVPFVLGTQRQGNTGQRLLIGILLGLAFIVAERLLTQLGTQFEINAFLVALMPNLFFFSIAVYLLAKKQTHGFGGGSALRRAEL